MSNTEDNHQAARVWAFAIYSIAFEALVWGGFGWAVFVRGASPWWALLALLLSACQLRPSCFGIR